MKDVLVQNGVPESAVLKEDQATYTYANALFSKQTIEKAGLEIKKAIICCKSYHARRCLMYYQTVFPDVEFLVCPAFPDGITRENWNHSKEGVEGVTGEISRIIHQFSLMM